MKMQLALLMMLIATLLHQATAGATTLKSVHHKKLAGSQPSSDIDVADNEEPAEDSEDEGGAADASADEAPRPIKLRQHRHHEAKTKQASASRDSISSLRQTLQKERALRLNADRLVKKLTAVLNHSTGALTKKREKAVAAEHAKLLAAEKNAALAKQAVAAEHVKRLAAEKNAVVAKQALAAEHVLRVAAEKKVAVSHVAASKMAEHKAVAASEIAEHKASAEASSMDVLQLKKEVDSLRAENERLTAANAKAGKDVERLSDNVDEAEAARKAKTEELKEKLEGIDNLKNKQMADLAALKHKDDKAMGALKQQLQDKEAKKEAAFNKKSLEAQATILALKNLAHDLNATDVQSRMKLSNGEQQVKHGQALVKKAEGKFAAEHKAFLKASSTISTQKAQLLKDQKVKKQLATQEGETQKALHQIKDLFASNNKLEQSNKKRSTDLKSALQKLKVERQTSTNTQKLLGQSKVKLQQASQAKTRADSRVHTLWEALKQKKAQLQIHDEELKTVQQELSATSEEKGALAKEFSVTQAKLAKVARDKKALTAAHAEIAEFGKKVFAENAELDGMRKRLRKAVKSTEDFNTVKAKLVEAATEQKELVDQLAASKQQEKDRLATVAAKMGELKVELLAADQKAKELKAKNIKFSNAVKKQDKELRDALAEEATIKANRVAGAAQMFGVNDGGDGLSVSDDDFLMDGAAMKLESSLKKRNITKAALLAGRSVLRSRNLQRELFSKDQELKKALAQLQSTQAEVNAKDMELEQTRQALLHAASIQLPSATAKEAAAARTALENVDGKLDAQEHELNATKTELLARKGEHSIEQQELQVLRDARTVLAIKVKKLSANLVEESQVEKKDDGELLKFKANAGKAEKTRQDLLRHNAELEKVANAAEAKINQENAAKTAAAQQAAAQRAAAEKVAAEEQRKEGEAQLQELQKRQAAEKAAAEAQGSAVSRSSSDDSDDDDDDDSDDDKGSEFANTGPWNDIQKTLSKNLKLADKM